MTPFDVLYVSSESHQIGTDQRFVSEVRGQSALTRLFLSDSLAISKASPCQNSFHQNQVQSQPSPPHTADSAPLPPSFQPEAPPTQQPQPVLPVQQLPPLHQDLLYPGFPRGESGNAAPTPPFSFMRTGEDLPRGQTPSAVLFTPPMVNVFIPV